MRLYRGRCVAGAHHSSPLHGPSAAPTDHFLSYKTKTTKGTAKFTRRSVQLAGDFEDVNVDVATVGGVVADPDMCAHLTIDT